MTHEIQGDLSPEFARPLPNSPEGYELRHMALARFEGERRIVEEFIQADHPDDYHCRRKVSDFDSIDRAIEATCAELTDYVATRAA